MTVFFAPSERKNDENNAIPNGTLVSDVQALNTWKKKNADFQRLRKTVDP